MESTQHIPSAHDHAQLRASVTEAPELDDSVESASREDKRANTKRYERQDTQLSREKYTHQLHRHTRDPRRPAQEQEQRRAQQEKQKNEQHMVLHHNVPEL